MAGSSLRMSSTAGNIAISGQQQAVVNKLDVREANPAVSPVSSTTESSDSNSSHDNLCSSTSNGNGNSSKTETKNPPIIRLRVHDAIMGRGGFTNNYIGNSNFRKLVNEHKMRYLSCNKMEKPKVAKDVVRIWKELDPPGRFLTKKEEGSIKRGEPTVWIECSDKQAQQKASQSLRERTPDVLPYLSKLQEHREQIREKGVTLISQSQHSNNSATPQFQGSCSSLSLDQGGSGHSAAAGASPTGMDTSGRPSLTGSMTPVSSHLPEDHVLEQTVSMDVSARGAAATSAVGMDTSARSAAAAGMDASLRSINSSLHNGGGGNSSMHGSLHGASGHNMVAAAAAAAQMSASASGGLRASRNANSNAARRMSMPAGGGAAFPPNGPMSSSSSSAVVTPAGMRQQMAAARRTSAPTINRLQGQQQQHNHPMMHPHMSPAEMMGAGAAGFHPDMAFAMECQRQQVLQEAYMAADIHGNVDSQTKRMFMEQMMMQEQEMMLLQEQEYMHRQFMMREQQFMMRQQHQQHQQRCMSDPTMTAVGSMSGGNGSAGVPGGLPAVTRDCDAMMPEHEKMMMDAARRQQQLLQESMKHSPTDGGKNKKRLAMEQQQRLQQNLLAQSMPIHVSSGHHRRSPKSASGKRNKKVTPDGKGAAACAADMLEPLPLDLENDENFVIPLDIIPDAAKSNDVIEAPKKEAKSPSPEHSEEKKDDSQTEAPAASTKVMADAAEKQEQVEKENEVNDCTLPLNDSFSKKRSSLKSAFKRPSNGSGTSATMAAAASAAAGDDEADQYRKTLEHYMTNHQTATAATGTIDIDDDISDCEVDLAGIDTTAWIQQALHNSGETAITPKSMKRKKRKSTRQDASASQDGALPLGGEKDEGMGAASGHSSRFTLMKEDLMSTDGKSMDCKSLDAMSFMSLAMSEMEKSMGELHVSATPGDLEDVDDDSDMESESINFGSRHGDRRMKSSSNQSVMSELTDFSDNEDLEDDGLGTGNIDDIGL